MNYSNAMSPKQSKIRTFILQSDDKRITLDRAVELIGGDIYHNERFHVGNILSNMVKRNILVRLKRGVYTLWTPDNKFTLTP